MYTYDTPLEVKYWSMGPLIFLHIIGYLNNIYRYLYSIIHSYEINVTNESTVCSKKVIFLFLKIRLLFLFCRCCLTRALTTSFLRFLDHTQLRTTVDRVPLDEWSARRRVLYLKTHNTNDKHPCPRRESNPQSQQVSRRRSTPLDCAATGTGEINLFPSSNSSGLKTRNAMYRVSINSFPDYKHLLQENYLDMLELYVAPQKSFSRG